MNKKKLCALVLTGVMAAQALGSSAYGAAFTDGTVQDIFSEEEQILSEDAGSTGEPITEPTPAAALTETPDKSEIFKGQESDVQNVEEVFSDGGEEDKFTSGPKEDEALAEEVISENGEPVRIGDAEYTYIPETDSYRVTCILGDGKTVVLEQEVNGKKVTEIGESVYYTTDDDEVYDIGGNVVIPNTVVRIADEAFEYGECTYMNIPDSVTEIGTGIFNSCFNLRTLRFTAGVKVFPAGLFRECENLETIEIPQGVEKIADHAMQGCPGLEAVHIPSSVTEIGETLFDEGTSVIIYGASGSYAQTYAREHQIPFQTEGETLPPSETKPKIDGVYYTYREDTDSYAVTGFGADIPQEVILPSTVNGKEVTEIADRAFYYCLDLQSIRIPGTIKHIGDSAFFQCVSLKDVTIEDGISTLGNYVFAYDRNLGSIEFPDSVTQIGEGCFYWGIVEKLKLSAGLKEISDGMLQYLYVPGGDIVIPDGVTRIGDAAFECLNCETVFISGTVKQIGNMAFAGAVIDKLVIPNSVKTIGDSAFAGLWLTSKTMVIPDSVTKIGKYIFSGCDAASITLGRGIKEIPEGAFLYTKAEALIIPDSVVSIQSKAFEDTDFYRIAVPANVRYIKKDAFLNNPYLTLFVKKNSVAEKYAKTMKIPYDNGSIYAAVVTKNGIQYQYNSKSGTYTLAKTDENLSGAVKILSSINGKKVVAIKEKAFFGRDKVTSVTIPESVTDIGTQAFYGCKAKKINIPKGIKILKEKVFCNSGIESISIPSSVVTIESEALAYTPIKNIKIPSSVTTIKDEAFEATELVEFSLPGTVKNVGKGILKFCEKLKKIQFPGGIKEIPEGFVCGCSNLETIPIPGSVKRIGADAFGGTGIEKIRLPVKLEEIGESTFSGCTNLKSIVLPGTLKKLGAEAFAYCESLSEVSIPGSVEKIFEETFENCTSLKKVVFEDGVRYVEADAFRGCEGNIREMHMTDSLMDIENPGKFENCTFYGFSETKIEDACIAFGFPFVSVGTNVLKAPKFKAAAKSGNCVQIHRDGYVPGADFYEYAISKDKNFPKTGKVLYQTEGDEECIFEVLDKGVYYVFARAYQDREWWYQVHDKRVYSDWSAPVKVQITQNLNPCKIQKVTVKGNTVTVTVKSVPGAEGYGIVLSEERSKDGCQKLLKPQGIKYGSKNNTSTTYTFKNVKPGVYCVLARAYKKLGGGQTVYSKWSGYSKRIQV